MRCHVTRLSDTFTFWNGDPRDRSKYPNAKFHGKYIGEANLVSHIDPSHYSRPKNARESNASVLARSDDDSRQFALFPSRETILNGYTFAGCYGGFRDPDTNKPVEVCRIETPGPTFSIDSDDPNAP